MSRRRKKSCDASRRDFIKTSAWVASGAVAGGLNGGAADGRSNVQAGLSAPRPYGSSEIRIGLVGCGRRGINATVQALNTAANTDTHPTGPVRLVALGDLFPNRIQAAYRAINGKHRESVDVPRSRQFAGMDAYRRVVDCDLDMLILASPPGWRSLHFEAAIRAGKHVFMEKPCAVDAPSVRRMLALNEQARRQELLVAVGLQRRHEPRYRETIARLMDGAIGEILFTRVYWNSGEPPARERRSSDTELQHQIRNWRGFQWLSGGLMCEQHIHNLDVSNWLMQGPPIECNGMSSRQVQNVRQHRQVDDQHFCEFTYSTGAKMYSQCRQVRGAWCNVSEHAHGARGFADISGGKIYSGSGELIWRSTAGGEGHQREQDDLFAALRSGVVYNEAEYGAASTMTALMGRMASETGQIVTWDEAVNSDVELAAIDSLHSLRQQAPVTPRSDGSYPAAGPGEAPIG